MGTPGSNLDAFNIAGMSVFCKQLILIIIFNDQNPDKNWVC